MHMFIQTIAKNYGNWIRSKVDIWTNNYVIYKISQFRVFLGPQKTLKVPCNGKESFKLRC